MRIRDAWRWRGCVGGSVLLWLHPKSRTATLISDSVMVTQVRREMNLSDNKMEQRATDALLNYETVKYFGNETFERQRYEQAINDFQDKEYTTNASLVLMSVLQGSVLVIGSSLGLLLIVFRITQGRLSVGDAALYLTYMTQLTAPLSYLSTYYRTIQKSAIDMENLFDLLHTHSPVADAQGAEAMPVLTGRGCSVCFEGVSFSYPSHQGPGSKKRQKSKREGELRVEGGEVSSPSTSKALRPVVSSMSFQVPAGSTMALVGSSGSGKSSILRLLLRFYDADSGSISVGGYRVGDVTQASLRRNIAVVPQVSCTHARA